VLLGPFATQHLADMGADVIKVEAAGKAICCACSGGLDGGATRAWGRSTWRANRNKRSLCLDLKKPAACAVLKDLIRTADLFIHNSRPAAIETPGPGLRRSEEDQSLDHLCLLAGLCAQGSVRPQARLRRPGGRA